ncbi:MAG: MBL fold metallo-hydrolase [Armatimonadota bacterium]|nr:MBL fold metallo-hydrolase [Armatimonadota bacterium]
MARIQRLADDLVLIDLRFQNTPQAVGAYLVLGDRPALIETGPASTLPHLLEGIREAGVDPSRLQAAAVTHIHLDHAGGAGALARLIPHLEVYVHPVGAPHLADPTRLVASAARLYGEALADLFGEIAPVPAGRLHPLADGETVVLGSRTLVARDTPGHARHHHVFWDPATGDLFTGDVAGVALPGSRYVRAPTPPPDLDVPAWERSLALIRSLRPRRLLLTHFGPHGDVEDLLDRLAESLHRHVELVRRLLAEGAGEDAIVDAVRAAARDEIARRDGADAVARHEVIMPVRQSVLGLIRYIRTGGPQARTG